MLVCAIALDPVTRIHIFRLGTCVFEGKYSALEGMKGYVYHIVKKEAFAG